MAAGTWSEEHRRSRGLGKAYEAQMLFAFALGGGGLVLGGGFCFFAFAFGLVVWSKCFELFKYV